MQRIGDREKGQLSLDEIESAEIQLIRSVQAQCFVDEKKGWTGENCKLRTQSCTLIRPMQRVFPLEVSGNSVTSLPLQKVQQIDLSMNCADPDTVKASVKPQVTRCGRPVKKPDKLNLLTLTDVFD
ncbi:DUF5641 domain-containing protein [Trichonephila clavata]|uniref:DUF5641 domain-containing protein n=1 Tax=Trichonephila clavata TaxID=2740835 RepID=A0A8X6JMY7_TRICU|nr:DUF5641 domain-containing protein [Trichonephila clavata]